MKRFVCDECRETKEFVVNEAHLQIGSPEQKSSGDKSLFEKFLVEETVRKLLLEDIDKVRTKEGKRSIDKYVKPYKAKSFLTFYNEASLSDMIHYALCDNCMNMYQDNLDREINTCINNNQLGKEFIENAIYESDKKNSFNESKEMKKMIEEILKLKIEEEQLKNRHKSNVKKINQLKQTDARLKEEEAFLWKQYTKNKDQESKLEMERQAYWQGIETSKKLLTKLRKSNAFADVFHISANKTEDSIGVINGFRIGRTSVKIEDNDQTLSPKPAKLKLILNKKKDIIEWEEVNVGLGNIAMLICCITKKCNFKFRNYQLIPLGSRSYIKRLSDSKKFNLYYIDIVNKEENNKNKLSIVGAAIDSAIESPLGKRFLNTFERFDMPKSKTTNDQKLLLFNESLVSLGVCIKELIEFARFDKSGKQINLKDNLFPIKSEILAGHSKQPIDCTINGLSLQLKENEIKWNAAMKLLLSNLKWLMVWISKYETDNNLEM